MWLNNLYGVCRVNLWESQKKTEAVPTGFEPAISALTGPHVWPLHHGTRRPEVYYTYLRASSNGSLKRWIIYRIGFRDF
jgi:hypothetical protein